MALNGCSNKQTEQTVVEVDPEKAREEAFLDRIEETIRGTIAESPIGSMAALMRLFQTFPIASPPETAPAKPETPSVEDESEEDWSAADDFMSGF